MTISNFFLFAQSKHQRNTGNGVVRCSPAVGYCVLYGWRRTNRIWRPMMIIRIVPGRLFMTHCFLFDIRRRSMATPAIIVSWASWSVISWIRQTLIIPMLNNVKHYTRARVIYFNDMYLQCFYSSVIYLSLPFPSRIWGDLLRLLDSRYWDLVGGGLGV